MATETRPLTSSKLTAPLVDEDAWVAVALALVCELEAEVELLLVVVAEAALTDVAVFSAMVLDVAAPVARPPVEARAEQWPSRSSWALARLSS